MSILVARLYLEIAILMTVGLGLTVGAFGLAARLMGRQRARPWLILARTVMVASLVLPPLARALLRPQALFPASVQVWSGETRRPLRLALTGFAPSPPARMAQPAALGEGPLTLLAVGLVSASVLGLIRFLRDVRRSWKLCKTATPIRRRGRLRVCISETAAVPFSAWTGWGEYVVVPEHFLLEPGHLRVALAHEFAHIRARDTRWVHAPAVLRALVPWHPAAALWARWLARLEEIACDERVLDRRLISPRAYGECLLWAAEAVRALSRPVGIIVPMLDRSRTFLERRITMLFDPPAPKRLTLVSLVGTAALIALGATSALARDAIADRRLGPAEVQALADDLARSTGFRVMVDESVVDEVNLVVSRAEARARFREGLERLSAYRPIGEEALRRRKVPVVLLAIPQTESRVQPLPEAMNPMRSAGIWQFIPATARRYGLRVDETTDERMEPMRSAEAAAALLDDLHERFQDWRLAVAAYNAGSEKVKRAIAENGTNDPVALVKAGAISRYASAVMAAALLIQRPDVLD